MTSSQKRRLRQMEAQAEARTAAQAKEAEPLASVRLLAFLRVMATAARRGGHPLADELEETVEVLAPAAETPGVQLIYYCRGQVSLLAHWLRVRNNPADPWHKEPLPLEGMAGHLKECIQIDRWQGQKPPQ